MYFVPFTSCTQSSKQRKQFWVVPGETIKVDKLEAEREKNSRSPSLGRCRRSGRQGAAVSQKGQVLAEVVRQGRGPKIIVLRSAAKGL